jgi:hypothetical protein
VAAGCGGDDGTSDPSSPARSAGEHRHLHPAGSPEEIAAMGQPDAPVVGPQGRVPQFVIECGFSHAAPDDPIVFPGQPGASHLHVFFGNTTTDADSTYESLLAGDTTCDRRLDTASYWAPALLDGGEVVEPNKSTAYYRPGLGVDPTTVQPFPAGLVMIAGDASATTPQPVSVVAWTCGTGSLREPSPPACPEGRTLRMVVTFPDCWDGERLDSENHRDHVHYSSGGQCPADHPVPVPQLTFTIEYPVSGPADHFVLASGPTYSAHADFVNSWDQPELESQVALCLHREVVCRITSGRV